VSNQKESLISILRQISEDEGSGFYICDAISDWGCCKDIECDKCPFHTTNSAKSTADDLAVDKGK